MMSDKLLTITDIANKLGFSVGHTKQAIIKLDGFPTPIRITPKGAPRWKESEIDAFIDSRKERF